MLSLKDCVGRIASRSTTPAKTIALVLNEINTRDASIGAFVSVDQAPRVDCSGPLQGIAVGIKDIIDTADFPTQMGSPLYEGWRPHADAWIVTKLKSLGATI